LDENHKPVETTAVKHADRLDFMSTIVSTVAMYFKLGQTHGRPTWSKISVGHSQHNPHGSGAYDWVCLQLRFEAPKDVKLEMLWRRAALSGNTSL